MSDFENDLALLEESLWRRESRFDLGWMESVVAPGFVEFGRYGTVYNREEVLAMPAEPFEAQLPDLAVRLITDEVALVTCSEVRHGEKLVYVNRSSLWRRTPTGWQLEFHQGTPVVPTDLKADPTSRLALADGDPNWLAADLS